MFITENNFDRGYYAKKLEDIRKELSLSKADFCIKLGISWGAYDRILALTVDHKISFMIQRRIKYFLKSYREGTL